MTNRHYRRTPKVRVGIQARMKSSKSRSDRVHVVADKNGWAVKREGAGRADRLFDRKSDAVSRAKSLSRVRNIVIHKRDGTIDSWERPSKVRRR